MVWLAHAPLAWDWEMPAVSLIAIALAGGLIGPAGAPEGVSEESDAGIQLEAALP